MSNLSDIRYAGRHSRALIPWVGRIGIVLLALSLCAPVWAQEGLVFMRDRTSQFPPEGPVQVSLVIPQTVLEMEGFNANMAYAQGGWIAGALAQANQARWNRRYEDQALRLSAPIEALDIQTLLVEALQRHLPGAITLTEEGILVEQAPVVAGSGDARLGPQHLHLVLDYYLLTPYHAIRMNLTALSPLESGNVSRHQHYRQRVIYDIKPEQPLRRAFSSPRQRMEQWQSTSPEYVRDQFVAGIDQLAMMLAYDIPLSVPRVMGTSRLPENERHGRSRSTMDHEQSLVGALLKEDGDREWVRLRSGLLWNTPAQ